MNSKKILLIDTSYPINSRNIRIIESLKMQYGSENIKYVAWNRDGRKINEDDAQNYVFCQYSPIGKRMIKLKNLNRFRNFIKETFQKFSPNVIIASHWECLALCVSLKKKNQIIIYENLDMPSGNPFIFKILRTIEKICLKKADAISYASRFYPMYYKWFKGSHIILENKIPTALAKPIPHTTENDDKLTIAFNGGVRYPEIFKNLFDAVEGLENVSIDIYGENGSNGDLVKKYGQGRSNIKFHGPYNYQEVPAIYSKMDIVWAVYPSKDFNVKLAISNKYNESIYYGVPGIFSTNTLLGKWVENNNIGYQVDGYSVSDIRNLIIMLRDNKKSEIIEKRKNMENGHLTSEKATWSEAVIPLLSFISSK